MEDFPAIIKKISTTNSIDGRRGADVMSSQAIENRKKELSEELERIKNVLINEYKADKIILFGSMATGNIHEWSDLDIIVVKDTDEAFIKRLKNIGLLVKSKVACDLIVYTNGEIEAMKKEKRSFILKVLEEGKVIYDARGKEMA
ncbi:nucleotidyltransferase domain-containing protein [Thermotalea metallivorans]|nr:nucleotidyltransferase domain-containing protein [Thermotalea metallivorans]